MNTTKTQDAVTAQTKLIEAAEGAMFFLINPAVMFCWILALAGALS